MEFKKLDKIKRSSINLNKNQCDIHVNPTKKQKLNESTDQCQVVKPLEELTDEMDDSTASENDSMMHKMSDSSEEFEEYYDEETDSESDDPSKLSWAGDSLSTFPRLNPNNLNVPPLIYSDTHKILIELPLRENEVPSPYPKTQRDKWDSKHVRMPNSSESMYPVKQPNGKPKICQRWPIICQAFAKPITSVKALYDAVISYNHRYKGRWKFDGLAYLLEEEFGEEEQNYFFHTLLPKIIKLALSLPQVVTTSPILLNRKETKSLTLSQKQIGCLLANAFLCTFPRRNARGDSTEYASFPEINFNRLFLHKEPSALEKMKCIIHYFKEITLSEPDGTVTFSRQYIKPEEMPQFEELSNSLPKFYVDSKGLIEETPGLLQVDFANKYIGGGVIGLGCVQEEIRFVLCPELLVSMLFTEVLDKHEALIVTGVQQYSKCKGYAESFEWVGPVNDTTKRDSYRRRLCQLVGIDAISFSRNTSQQYNPNLVLRELKKAYAGFKVLEGSGGAPVGIASGNWGCGAFRGDSKLKALIQIAAAGAAGRDLAYFTFGNKKLRGTLVEMHSFLVKKKVTVGQLVMILCQYGMSQKSVSGKDLYEYIRLNLSTPESTDTDGSNSIIESSQPTTSTKSDEPTKPKTTIKDYFKSVFKSEATSSTICSNKSDLHNNKTIQGDTNG